MKVNFNFNIDGYNYDFSAVINSDDDVIAAWYNLEQQSRDIRLRHLFGSGCPLTDTLKAFAAIELIPYIKHHLCDGCIAGMEINGNCDLLVTYLSGEVKTVTKHEAEKWLSDRLCHDIKYAYDHYRSAFYKNVGWRVRA